MLPLLEKVIGESKPLVIVAEDVEAKRCRRWWSTRSAKTFPAVAVKGAVLRRSPQAFLQDLAIGHRRAGHRPEIGLKLDQIGLDVLGRAGRVVVTRTTRR